MVATESKPRIGMGMYTPREAALYAKLLPKTFNRWFYGDGQGESVLTPRLQPVNGDRVVTFWDLMQAVAVRTLRTNPKAAHLKLPHIRAVVKECEKKGLTFPLARQHALYVFGSRLILKTEADEFIGLEPGVDADQLYQAKIIEPFLSEVTWGQNKMAQAWAPLSSPNFRVSLDADRRFGMPTIEPLGILVSALTDAVESEHSIQGAAEAFETDVEAVNLALKYQEYLLQAA